MNFVLCRAVVKYRDGVRDSRLSDAKKSLAGIVFRQLNTQEFVERCLTKHRSYEKIPNCRIAGY